MKHFYLIILSALIFTNCSKDEDITIKEYLEDHKIEALYHSSGIFYTIELEGSGGHPSSSSDVTTHYKGYYLDGTKFDSSPAGDPRTFNLENVIEGWQIGIPLFQRGGNGTLYIPSHLAYGSNPPSGVRADAPMAFDITLVDFE